MSRTGIKTFLLEREGTMRRYLRRFQHTDKDKSESICPIHGHHNAKVFYDDQPALRNKQKVIPIQNGPDHEHPLWPKQCDCGYVFRDGDYWQVFTDEKYRRVDTGQVMTLEEAPAGAIWRAEWLECSAMWTGPDGKAYMCRLPNGHDWHIDGPATNCDQPKRAHKCWVRTGEAPDFDVGKGEPGESCTAGAGSILSGDWHGFLRHGYLVQCILMLILFSGCAGTKVYEDGKLVFKTQADATNIDFQTAKTRFHADRLDHSTPTLAQGQAASQKIGAIGGAVAASGITALLKK